MRSLPAESAQALPLHEVATLFPPMTDEEYADLVADIKSNGLLVPIDVCDGKVVDGRHRQLACFDAGVEPIYADCVVDGPLISEFEFVVAKNLKRRHLSASQKSMVSARISILSSVGKPPKANRNSVILPNKQPTIAESSKMLGVSEKSTRLARKVIEANKPVLIEAVDSGVVAVADAAKFTEKPEAEIAEKVAIIKGEGSTKPKTLEQAFKPKPKRKHFVYRQTKQALAWRGIIHGLEDIAKAMDKFTPDQFFKEAERQPRLYRDFLEALQPVRQRLTAFEEKASGSD